MSGTERKTIKNLVDAEAAIYGMQDGLDREQERIIADVVSPAETIVKKLVALDNRRIDLCNIKVLNEYIRRELCDEYPLFLHAVSTGDDAFSDRVTVALARAGYTVARVGKEFSYVFAKIKKNRVQTAILSALCAVGVEDDDCVPETAGCLPASAARV